MVLQSIFNVCGLQLNPHTKDGHAHMGSSHTGAAQPPLFHPASKCATTGYEMIAFHVHGGTESGFCEYLYSDCRRKIWGKVKVFN